MSRFRVVPPVHSPIMPGAIAAGFANLLGGSTRAHSAVAGRIMQLFAPRDLLLLDSGTTALALALRAARRVAPGPAALPAYCCYDVATAADGAQVEVLLYDVDPATLGPDLPSLRDSLERGARTVVIAHLYGIPLDLAPIEGLLSHYDAWLIEDAAQGAGASRDGRPLGSACPLGVLSFGRGKGITGGRGGALLANDEQGSAALGLASEHLPPGRVSAMEPIAVVAQWLLARPALYAIPASVAWLGLGDTVYRAPRPARAMSPFALGVLAKTLASAEREAETRRRNAARLLSGLDPTGGALRPVQPPRGTTPGYLRLPVLVSGGRRSQFGSDAARRLGIMPGYPGTLAELPGFGAKIMNQGSSFPGAQSLVRSLVTLPTHSLLSDGDLSALERWVEAPGSEGR